MKKQAKNKNINFLKVFDKKKTVFSDLPHVTGFGDAAAIKKPLLRKYYGYAAFDFSYLEQAKKFFEGIIGSNDFDPSLIHVYIANINIKYQAPILFLYDSEVLFRRKRRVLFFAIAPLKVEEN